MSLGSRPLTAGRGRAGAAPRVLVVDDDAKICALLRWRLETDGLVVTEARDGQAALREVADHAPDLVILDLNLPVLGGLDVLARIREGTSIPVIVLTGRAGEAERIVGLDRGADDYVVKPFSPAEMSARVRAVLRRGRGPVRRTGGAGRLQFSDLVIDPTTHEVIAAGRAVELTATEFALLHCLAASPRRAFSRGELLELAWDATGAADAEEATVTQHVHRLRAKLEADPARPRWVRTVTGVGYRFEP